MKIYIDFETKSNVPISYGLDAYCSGKEFEILCLAYAVENEKPKLWIPSSEELPDIFYDDGHTLVAHNADFERRVFEYFGMPTHLHTWHCTMKACRFFAVSGMLKYAGECLNVKSAKYADMGGRLVDKICVPKRKQGGVYWQTATKKEYNDLYRYCKQDVRVCRDLYKELSKLFDAMGNYHLFKKASIIDNEMNDYGVKVDAGLVDKMALLVEQYEEKAREYAIKKFGLNPASPVQLKAWLHKHGVMVEDTTKETINSIETKSKKVQQLIELRKQMSKTSVKKLPRVQWAISYKDRLRDMMVFHGAHTGRWSSKIVQLQNFPRASNEDSFTVLKQKLQRATVFNYASLMQDLLPCIFVATKGHLLAKVDFSAIEARIAYWLAGCEGVLTAYKKGLDVYKETAAAVFGKPAGKVTAGERYLGKQLVLGCNFGLGADGFFRRLSGGTTRKESDRIHNAYRRTYMQLPDYWYSLEKNVKYVLNTKEKREFRRIGIFFIDGVLILRLPSGRSLFYHSITRTKDGLHYYSYAKHQYITLYGSKIFENLVQAIAYDIFVEAMSRMPAYCKKLFTVHDEAVFEFLERYKKKVSLFLDTEFAKTPDWAAGLPLSIKYKIQRRYDKK